MILGKLLMGREKESYWERKSGSGWKHIDPLHPLKCLWLYYTIMF